VTTALVAIAAALVAAAVAFAVASARARGQLAADHERFGLIRGAALIADADLRTEQVVERLQMLLTPDFARTCEVELGTTAEPRHREHELIVPMRSRGRDVGTLRLTHAQRTYTPADHEFAQLIAGRAALALENAALARRQTHLTTALDTLAEAVTIQDAERGLIYANDAAAAVLDFETAEQLLATRPEDIIDSYESFLEDGRRLTLEDLPGRAVLQGRRPEPVTVRAIHKRTREERWRVVKATAVPGHPTLAVNVIEDITDVKRAEHAQRFLAQAGAVLASSLDYEQTLGRITRLAVPRLADWCSVSLPAADRLVSVAVSHADPARIAFARDYERRYPTRLDSESGPAQVLRTATASITNDVDDALLDRAIPDPEQRELLKGLGMRAVMIVPMVTGGRAIGVLSFVSAESGRSFSRADRELAEELGRRAGSAVENARLYRERSHIAQTLQKSLLPEALPAIPGLRVSSLYRPAGAENLVGGDFYDAFPTGRGWLLLVGDVTGRGAEAAAQTAQARHTLRTAGMLLGDPAQAVHQLNRALTDRRELAPCTVALVHVSAQTAEVVCAGHPQPLLIRAGEPRPIGHFGPMVGAWADSAWAAETLALEPGDVLVLYTDGVTDAKGAAERFGDANLVATLRGVDDAAGAVAAIDRALNAFQKGPQADDTAVLAFDLPLNRP
jgi:serine phosphatase RsbU (regulator of sigma subunit)/PAS domain-containing protein